MTPIEPQYRQLGLSDYLAILNRRKWIIIQSTVIVAVVAFILSAQQAKVFSAGAEVLLTRQNLSNVVTGVHEPGRVRRPGAVRRDAGRARARPGGRAARDHRCRAPRAARRASSWAAPT